MKSDRKNWTREELILALDLYCRMPFGQIHGSNPHIVKLAAALGRTPSAVSMKMCNFARLDPALQNRKIAGLSHGSKKDVEIWNEFDNRWQNLALMSADIQRAHYRQPLADTLLEPDDIAEMETEKEATVKVRLVQRFFRQSVLSSYNSACSICQIAIPALLNASHIIPWSDDESKRADPRNGICLCALHDRAFDRGYLAVDGNLQVLVSREVTRANVSPTHKIALLDIQGQPINLPERFHPHAEYFEYHRAHIFQS